MEKVPTPGVGLGWGKTERDLAKLPQGDDTCASPQRMSSNRGEGR